MVKGLHRHSHGFTLIELLVVVAILGLLAGIAIPAVSHFIGSGKTESARTELHNVSLAVTAAMADNVASTLTPGHITNTPTNTVTYNDGVADVTLPIGDFITGGLEELMYEYDVESDGNVEATTGPLADS